VSNDKTSRETITWVHHWSPGLMSFKVSRPEGFAFVPGQFARLGLEVPDEGGATRVVSRAYSMVSTPAEDELEFYLIVIPGGEFSSRLASLPLGAEVLVERVPYGFLTADRFPGGRDLWLLATGTGLSAYLSIARDAATWAQWDRIVLVHSVRSAAELTYRDLIDQIAADPRWGGAPGKSLHYLPIVTRESGAWLSQRIPEAIASGDLEKAVGFPLDAEASRVMICGNPDMVKATRATLAERGFKAPRRGNPGNLVVENYW